MLSVQFARLGYHRSDVLMMAECTTCVSCVLARKGRERRESEGGERRRESEEVRVRKAAAVGGVSC